MRTPYDKLIRDRIPEIIARSGRQYGVEVLTDEAYRAALRAKLVEEASEATVATPESLLAELADLTEVIDALLAAHRIERPALLAEQERRRDNRGGFSRRLRLLRTE